MKTKAPSQRMAKVNLRMPPELRSKLRKLAEKEGRSMNAQAVVLLAERLKAA